jgi:hypothetical protein
MWQEGSTTETPMGDSMGPQVPARLRLVEPVDSLTLHSAPELPLEEPPLVALVERSAEATASPPSLLKLQWREELALRSAQQSRRGPETDYLDSLSVLSQPQRRGRFRARRLRLVPPEVESGDDC